MTARPILKSCFIPPQQGQAPGAIVLREWEPGEEWATHFHNLQDGGFYYGHYFRSLPEAEADYEKRVQQYLGNQPAPSFIEQQSPVLVPQPILEGLDAVRKCGTTNMFDIGIVKVQAVALGYPQIVEWLETHVEEYRIGLFKGFEALQEYSPDEAN